MHQNSPNPKSTSFPWRLHALLFLLAIGAGAGMIYSLQPPKPPPTQLIYDLFLFSSNTSVTDFATQSELMKLGVNVSADNAPGPRIISNIQLATAEKIQTTLMLALGGSFPPSHPFPQIGNVQINVVGEETKGRIRTKLEFKTGEGTFTHRFISGEEEVRVLQLDSAGRPGHQYFYALVRVQPMKAAPQGTLSLPNPASPRLRIQGD